MSTLWVAQSIGNGIVLSNRCFGCNGAKYVTNPAWVEYNKRYDAVFDANKMKPTEIFWQIIDKWNDENPIPNEPDELECGECDGTGEILTADGQTLINFVRSRV